MDDNVVVKKKRGRKPNPVKKEEPVVEKKKRGRKPNPNKKVEEKAAPRKRGRKPKIKYDILPEPEPIIQQVENVILYLPIKSEQLENISDNKMEKPKPYLDDDINQYQDINFNSEEKVLINISSIDKKDLNNPNILETISEKRKEELSSNNLNNKANLIFVDFYESNKEKQMPESTNINCLWDTEPFQNRPYAIPMKKVEDTYYMYGNFCCPECAAAYLFDMNCEDDELWERYSMLNYLYTNNETIKLALPRITLKKFGGIKSIEEFRTCSDLNKSYDVVMPPMISIIPSLEEIILNNETNGILDFSNNMLNKSNELKLKREKPLPDFKNSLENCMNLKYV